MTVFVLPHSKPEGPVPCAVLGHDVGVGADVLRTQLGQLVRLGVDPTEGLLHLVLSLGGLRMAFCS